MTQKFSLEERLNYLKQYGSHCMAYSTLQPGMKYFDLPGIGYLAYMQYCGTRFVLSDPITAPENYEKILDSALEEHKKTSFVQIRSKIAEILSKRGYYINSFGVENTIDVNDFKISWNVRRDLKRWISSVPKAGIRITEDRGSILDRDIEKLSEEWRSTKTTKHELAFLARPLSTRYEEGVRRFFGINGSGDLVGFCSFDPCYHNGEIISYSINHIRESPEAPNGTTDFIIVSAIEQFKKEGIKTIHLGLSPLHNMDHTQYKGSPITKGIANLLYERASKIYRFKQLGFHKDRFKANKSQTYLGFRSFFSIPEIFGLMRLCRVI